MRMRTVLAAYLCSLVSIGSIHQYAVFVHSVFPAVKHTKSGRPQLSERVAVFDASNNMDRPLFGFHHSEMLLSERIRQKSCEMQFLSGSYKSDALMGIAWKGGRFWRREGQERDPQPGRDLICRCLASVFDDNVRLWNQADAEIANLSQRFYHISSQLQFKVMPSFGSFLCRQHCGIGLEFCNLNRGFRIASLSSRNLLCVVKLPFPGFVKLFCGQPQSDSGNCQNNSECGSDRIPVLVQELSRAIPMDRGVKGELADTFFRTLIACFGLGFLYAILKRF